jgi:general secretion pathway protein A
MMRNATMYSEHFRLKEPPFSIAPDPRYLYMSDQHREALAHLMYGVGHGGVALLTGEIGTGKTTLCRCLRTQLPETCDLVFVFNPKVTEAELLATICDELGIAYPPGTVSTKALMDLIGAHLLRTRAAGRTSVLLIDEAQNLDATLLETMRVLTNLETDDQKLLQIILVGQPELRTVLERPEFQPLAQRITARFHLRPLAREEIGTYVTHRIKVAGKVGSPFAPDAVREVFRRSGGVPRIINILCDRAMLAAFVEDVHTVTRPLVVRAAREAFGLPSRKRKDRPVALIAAGVAGLAVLIGGIGLALLSGPDHGATSSQGSGMGEAGKPEATAAPVAPAAAPASTQAPAPASTAAASTAAASTPAASTAAAAPASTPAPAPASGSPTQTRPPEGLAPPLDPADLVAEPTRRDAAPELPVSLPLEAPFAERAEAPGQPSTAGQPPAGATTVPTPADAGASPAAAARAAPGPASAAEVSANAVSEPLPAEPPPVRPMPGDVSRAEVASWIDAYRALFARWDLTYRPGRVNPCQQAEQHGLGCLHHAGDVQTLRQLNRPAVLTLADGPGSRTYVALMDLYEDRARFAEAGTLRTMALPELAARWTGEFTMLWRKPPGYARPLYLGDEGEAVAWVDAHLANARGEEAAAGGASTFDEDLLREVKQFQAEHGMQPDGIIGPLLLIRLNAGGARETPSLQTTVAAGK